MNESYSCDFNENEFLKLQDFNSSVLIVTSKNFVGLSIKDSIDMSNKILKFHKQTKFLK